jgi:hypothetical protein
MGRDTSALLVNACSTQAYRDTKSGSFRGVLDVRWVKNDFFIFIPSKTDPLTFTRSNGKPIQPGIMYTDGGSIPQFLWGVEGFSPWGYAPAYIIHDWLFEAQHCGHKPDNDYTFLESADILAEGLKTIMESDDQIRNYFVFDSVYSAVKSSIAKKRWDNGECKPPIMMILEQFGFDSARALEQQPGELIMRIQFK